jgi:hypothetical protein
MRSYGQYCPIARASELLAERWSIIVLRNIVILGCRTFNEIADAHPACLEVCCPAGKLPESLTTPPPSPAGARHTTSTSSPPGSPTIRSPSVTRPGLDDLGGAASIRSRCLRQLHVRRVDLTCTVRLRRPQIRPARRPQKQIRSVKRLSLQPEHPASQPKLTSSDGYAPTTDRWRTGAGS